jgi:hypothetical protein
LTTQNAVAIVSTPIPASIEQLWGTPDLLRGEDPAAYKALWMDIAKDMGPSNVIEWLWINDILELSWEIRRLRRVKRQVMDRKLNMVLAGDFDEGLVNYKKLDVLEASAEARRNAVFREIEWRRSTILAGRVREASDNIIEGHAIALPPQNLDGNGT